MSESSPTPSSRWSELRDFCAAIRELLVIVAIVLLLITPGTVRNLLERAGVHSVAGVEFDAKTLGQAQSELENAQLQMEQLRSQLIAAQQQMNQPNASSGELAAARADPRNGDVSRILAQMQSKLDDTENSLDRSKRLHDRAFRRVELPPLEDIIGSRPVESSH